MAKFGKWIGGALGWAIGGPIGGILGFTFGTMFDDNSFSGNAAPMGDNRGGYKRRYQEFRHHTKGGDFASALLVLSASVMKADGRLMKSELNFIQSFFKRQFGEMAAAQHMGVLQEVLKKDIPLREVCEQIKYFMEHAMRLQLLHYLFGIAKADGTVHGSEVRIIEQIAHFLGISQKDYESIKAMFYKDAASSYKILEIDQTATEAEIKKAYRKMANKYHPDKVRDLGESYQKAATEKFHKVQEAYENLKKERGIK